jgi:hypothetical protein
VAEDVAVVVPSAFTKIAIAVSVAITLLLGVLPEQVLEAVTNAGLFVR